MAPSELTVRDFQLPRRDLGEIHYAYDISVSNFGSVWDKQLLASSFPPGNKTLYFTLACDPVVRVARLLRAAGSSYPLEAFARAPDKEILLRNLTNNERAADPHRRPAVAQPQPQLQPHQIFASVDLGLHVFRIRDDDEVRDFLGQVSEDFDFVLVAEQLERSLVILKEILGWTLGEVAVATPDRQSGSPDAEEEVARLSPEAKLELEAWLEPDLRLYEHVTEAFDRKLAEFGSERVGEQAEALELVNAVVTNTCRPNVGGDEIFSDHYCDSFYITEERLLKML